MSKKYIGQVDNQNFIYPNNNLAEYDIEIIHDINDNNVTGSTSGLTITLTGSNLNVAFSYVWDLNNGERYINDANQLSYLSVHMMDSSNLYYKPFRCISGYTTTGITSTTISGSTSIIVTPAMLGVAAFTGGTYNLEFRFIGHRNIYPIGTSYTVAAFTPTPTPTPTITPTPGLTLTPTPTPTVTPSSGSDYYYQGIICGVGTFGQFYSNTNLGEAPSGVFRAYSSIAGSNQCFDSVTQIFTPNLNPILGIYEDCANCSGATYAYYEVLTYTCFPCTVAGYVTARTLASTTLTTGYYYNNGDGNVYLVTGYASGPAYTVDLQGAATDGTNCAGTCAI